MSKWDFIREVGRLESFEIKNSSKVLCLISLGVFFYSLLIHYLNPSLIYIPFAREFFSILFLFLGLLPLTKSKIVINYYGLLVFIPMFF